MPNVLELLTGRAKQRQASHEETLWAAAKLAAAGKSVDVDAVDAALVATGRTPEAFAEMADLARRRRAWAADLAKQSAAEAAAAKGAAALAEAEAAFTRARDQWHGLHAKLRAEVDGHTATVARSRDAHNALVHPDSCPGALGDRIRAARTAADDATQRVATATRAADELRAIIKSNNTQLDELAKRQNKALGTDPDDTPRAEGWRLNVTRATRRLAEADQELAAARQELAAATDELAAAEDAALKL